MKNSFRVAFKIYKYLLLAFVIGYLIYVLIDDFIFIEKYWDSNWLEYILIWSLYLFVYLAVVSIYYWLISAIIIFIYHKVIIPFNKK